MKRQDYNNEPVYYCNSCFSLNIKEVHVKGLIIDLCQECGNVGDIKQASLEQWNKLYVDTYGTVFLEEEDLDSIAE